MDRRDQIVLVTGASSGIGNACATYLAKKGYRTYGSCREPQKYQKKADEYFELLALDLVDDASVARAAGSLLGAEHRIDHLVCCAGMGLVGSVEECSIEEARLQFETDYFGTLKTIKAFLPAMRQAGKGHIIVTTSLAAQLGLPYIAHYSAAKRALDALVQSLRYEVDGYGIEVCSLAVGPFRSAFSESLRLAEAHKGEGPYFKAKETLVRTRESRKAEDEAPLAAAKAVYSLIGMRKMPVRKNVGPIPLRLAVFGKRLWGTTLAEAVIRRLFHTSERK